MRLTPGAHRPCITLSAKRMKSARSLVVIERTTTFDQDEEPTIAFYTTSHSPTRGFASKQSVDAGTGLRQL